MPVFQRSCFRTNVIAFQTQSTCCLALCSANARVASTLSTPGVTDLLFHLGFEHTPETSSEASTSAAAAAPFDPASPSGVIHLPVDLPGQQEPLFHGALSLLRPLVADAATGMLPSTADGTVSGWRTWYLHVPCALAIRLPAARPESPVLEVHDLHA